MMFVFLRKYFKFLKLLPCFYLKAPRDLLTRTMSEVVEYLKQPYKTDLETIRVLFAWFCNQGTSDLPNTSSAGNVEKSDVEILAEVNASRTIGEILADIIAERASIVMEFYNMCK